MQKPRDNKAPYQDINISEADFLAGQRHFTTQDPYLECLVYLTAHFGQAKSSESLKAGLAYDEHGMGPALFCEAAERQDLNAKIVRRPQIKSINKAVLPCVLAMQDQQACVLLEIPKSGKTAKIFLPETQGIRELPLQELQFGYTGYAIFTHPRAKIETAETSSDDTDRHWFWGIVNQSAGTYGMIIFASLFINIFALVSPLFVMNVYDRVIPNNATETGWALGIGALAAFVFDFIFRTLRGYLIDLGGRKIDVIAARRIYDQLLNIRLSERPQSSGAFANMLRDFDAVREFFTSATITAVVDLPFTLIFLFFVYQLGGPLVFILLLLMGLAIGIGCIIQIRLKVLVRKSVKSSETKHGLLVETIHGLETVKATNAGGRFRARYGQYVGDNAITSQQSRSWSAFGLNIAGFLQQVSSVALILTGMYMVQDGDLTVGGLIATVILGGRAIAPIGQIANLLTRYHQAGGALKTLNGIMNRPVERPAHAKFLHRPDLKGKITFDKVSFAYPGTQVTVLDQVSFTIRPGEKVGIIGRIGSGKSTIARLMVKLYEPGAGTILIDDTDSRQIDPADLRRNLVYISQDVVLFNGTIRDNVTASLPQASEEAVLDICKAAGVHDFVSRHPMGYDAPVGEGGSSLSGGQRQAVALARAMLLEPNVLICDEPTNAMDMQAEKAFCDYIQQHIGKRGLVLITHKHSMLHMVDRLILLHNGKLVMDAPRDEVIAALNAGSIKVKE